MKSLTIKKRLIAILVILPLVPVLVLTLLLSGKIKENSVQSFVDSTTRELKHVDTGFVFFMDGIKSKAKLLASSPVLEKAYGTLPSYTNTTEDSLFPHDQLGEYGLQTFDLLKRTHATSAALEEVFLGTQNGEFLSDSSATLPAKYDPRKRGWYEQALAGGGGATASSAYLTTSGNLVVSVCSPFAADNGKILGVVAFDISLNSLTDVIKNITIGETGYAILLQEDSTILANPKHEETIFKKTDELGNEALATLGKMREGYTYVELDGKEYLATVYTSETLGYHFIGLITKAEVMQKYAAILKIMLVVSLVLIGLFIILALWLAQGIVRPMKNAVAVLDASAAEGDLTKRLQIERHDEMGELAGWFNNFIEKLQGIIREITSNSSDVNSASTHLATVSENLLGRSEETTERANNVAAAAEKMTANLSSVAAAMEQSATNANAVAGAAEEMNATIKGIAENSEHARSLSGNAVSETKGAASFMGELGDAADKIGKVTETITAISDQTNLLALNATIEAARAGEAGKGFAVVANEIKELAQQTAGATLEIKSLIEAVQNTTGKTGRGIDNIARVISEVNDIITAIAEAVNEQAKAANDIAGNISQASLGIQEVNDKVSQSSTTAADITRDIAQVSTAAQSITESSQMIEGSAKELASNSGQLQEIVNSFKV